MTWTVLQSANGNNGGGSASNTTTATFVTANISAGSKIIAYVTVDVPSGISATGVADGASNAWTLIGRIAGAGNVQEASIWALDAPAGDIGTKPAITATASANCDMAILVQEVSGLARGNTTAMCDGTPATLTGNTSGTGSPSYSTSAAGEFLVSLYGDFGDGFTIGTAGGWTADPGNRNTSGTVSLMLQYKSSTGGTESDGFTSADTTGGWEIITVAFRLASAGAAPAAPAPLVVPQAAVMQAANW